MYVPNSTDTDSSDWDDDDCGFEKVSIFCNVLGLLFTMDN